MFSLTRSVDQCFSTFLLELHISNKNWNINISRNHMQRRRGLFYSKCLETFFIYLILVMQEKNRCVCVCVCVCVFVRVTLLFLLLICNSYTKYIT